jgi:hypothetical protein
MAKSDPESMMLCYHHSDLVVAIALFGLKIPGPIYDFFQTSMDKRAGGCPHTLPVFIRTILLAAISLHKAGVIDLENLPIPEETPAATESTNQEVEELKRLFKM